MGFTVVSDLDAASLGTVLNTLNRFEPLTARYLPGTPAEIEIPMQMLIFSSNRVFREYFGNSRFAGFLQPSLISSTVVISPDRGNRALLDTAMHEYSHYLLRNRLDVSLPLWFDEGLASLLATAEFHDDGATLGRLPLEKLRALMVRPAVGRLSLKETLTTDFLMDWSRSRIDDFYGWSQLLTHYLMLGDPARRAMLDTFLRERERPLVAYLDTTYRGLERHLARYVSGAVPTVFVPLAPRPPLDLAPECLDPLSRDLAIGRAIVDRNPSRALELTASQRAAHPDDVRLLVLESRARAELGGQDEAISIARQAYSIDPDDARVLSNLADQLVQRCLFSQTEECRQRWREATPLYRAALAADNQRFDAVFGLGLSYLYSGRPGEAVNYLKVAYVRAPWAVPVNFFLGESYRLIGDSRARVYLENSRNWAQNKIWRKLADAALEQSGS